MRLFPPCSNHSFPALRLRKPELPSNMRGSFYVHLFPFKWRGNRKTISPTSCQWWWDCCGVLHLRNDQEPGKAWKHPKMSKRRGLQPPSRLRDVIHGLSVATGQPHRARLGCERTFPLVVTVSGGKQDWFGIRGPRNPDSSPQRTKDAPIFRVFLKCSHGCPWRWKTCP